MLNSVAGIALLTPWVAVDVIAELLPKARHIVWDELKRRTHFALFQK